MVSWIELLRRMSRKQKKVSIPKVGPDSVVPKNNLSKRDQTGPGNQVTFTKRF